MYSARSPPGCSLTMTVSRASAPTDTMNSRSSPATYTVPASTKGSKPITASMPPPMRRYRPMSVLPQVNEAATPSPMPKPWIAGSEALWTL